MTINICLHCRDGIVFGCDSLGSMIQSLLEPGTGTPLMDKNTGKPLLHPESNEPIIDIKTMKRRNVVVNSLGYENKLISIRDYPIGILSSGVGMIGNKCMEDLIAEFSLKLPEYKDKKGNFKVKELLLSLKKYIAALYFKEFKTLPQVKAGPKLNFVVSGYSDGEFFGEMYELKFPSNELKKLNSYQKPYGMVTGGQDDAIQRFIKGMEDDTIKSIVGGILNKVNSLLTKMEKHTKSHIFKEIKKNKIKFSEKDISPTPKLTFQETIPLKLAAYNIPFNLFSIQNAVDFVVFLIYIIYGRQRFVVGIPTVGGKVRIAYITKHEGFKDLTPKKIDVSIFKI